MPAYGRRVVFGGGVREGLGGGVDLICNAVRVTLGPGGRHVIYRDGSGVPVATKDGVTVARKVDAGTELGDVGVAMVREVALKTLEGGGDGTTTACVLAQAMYVYGVRCVEGGEDPWVVKRRLDAMVAAVDDYLGGLGVVVDPGDRESLMDVAMVSSNGDVSVAGIVADAFMRVGGEGVVMVERGEGFDTRLSYIEGMEFGRGYMSPYFITDAGSRECRLDSPYVFIYHDKVSSLSLIRPLLAKFANTDKSLLVVCNDMDADILGAIVANKQQGILRVSCLKSPSFGELSFDLLEDLAILTGGRVLDRSAFNSLDALDVDGPELGRCRSVVMTDGKTRILGGCGKADVISGRVKELRDMAEAEADVVRADFLRHRASKLSGGVCVIKSGGATESEMLERKDRIEDAVCAVRAALAEGVVPGGGVALLRASACVAGDERGILERPMRQILENAGVSDVAGVVSKVLESGDVNYGFDARGMVYCDMMASGIVDPLRVVRLALRNAASIAGLLLTTECVIADHFENIHDGGFGGIKKMLGGLSS